MQHLIQKAADILSVSDHVVVSTGAGISRESGIPTFRETESGLWKNFDPDELCTLEGFIKNPPLVWNWYQDRIKVIEKVQPNPGHYAVATLEKFFDYFDLITQNIDNLHQKAGSKNVCELHGNILKYKCLEENTLHSQWPKTEKTPPECPDCGAYLRPNVVWFGEQLPEKEIIYAYNVAGKCDCMIVIGTSGVVQPAASLPFIAKQSAGAKIIEINPEITPITTISDVFLSGKAGEILPQIVKLLEKQAG